MSNGTRDPAFLFYSSDFLVGTFDMTDEQVGRYIRLMCLQHQKGELTEAVMLSVMGGVWDEAVAAKFIRSETGTFYNERLLSEMDKRRAFTESRRKNLESRRNRNEAEASAEIPVDRPVEPHMVPHMEAHMDSHMENANEDENESEDKEPKAEVKVAKKKPKTKPFAPPTVAEVEEYCRSRNNNIDAGYFVDYYMRCDWLLNTGFRMKDWRATVRTWERNDKKRSNPSPVKITKTYVDTKGAW